jgi:hypothetical protein
LGKNQTIRFQCNGDSGGPLTVTLQGVTLQVGVVSFGSAIGCETDKRKTLRDKIDFKNRQLHFQLLKCSQRTVLQESHRSSIGSTTSLEEVDLFVWCFYDVKFCTNKSIIQNI